MIRYLSIIYVLIIFSNSSAQNNNEKITSKIQDTIILDTTGLETSGSIISFNNTSYDAGEVLKGSNLTYGFEFFNKGNEALFITNVRAGCSCTVASYPKAPILPNASEKIILELSTKKSGQFNKVVAIYSNAINDFDDSINKSRIILNISWSVFEESNKTKNNIHEK